MGSSITTRRKSWEKVTILGAFGVTSEIQRATFGVFITYIIGDKILGLRHEFQRQILGPSPPPDMEVPPGVTETKLHVKILQ